MGNATTKVFESEYETLSRECYFTKQELTKFVKHFVAGNTKRKWTQSDVRTIFQRFFPHASGYDFADMLFARIASQSHDSSHISFEDLVLFLNGTTKGTAEERADWLFRMLAQSNDNTELTPESAARVVAAASRLAPLPPHVGESDLDASDRLVSSTEAVLDAASVVTYLEDLTLAYMSGGEEGGMAQFVATFMVEPLLAQIKSFSYRDNYEVIPFDTDVEAPAVGGLPAIVVHGAGVGVAGVSESDFSHISNTLQGFGFDAGSVSNAIGQALHASHPSNNSSNNNNSSNIGLSRFLLGESGSGSERVPGVWTTLRVFISSTFVDMHGERDALIERVFPELNARATSRWVRLVPVDLRWGVTSEMVESIQQVCLDEIDRCRRLPNEQPWFVGLRGKRAGWIPDTLDPPNTFAHPEYAAWTDQTIPWSHLSITDMEAVHAVLAADVWPVVSEPAVNTPPHSFFYFRDDAFMRDAPSDARWVFDFDYALPTEHKGVQYNTRHDAHEIRASHALIDAALRESEERAVSTTYTPVYGHIEVTGGGVGMKRTAAGYVASLDGFCDAVMTDMWAAIDAEFPELESDADPLSVERVAHISVIRTRAHGYVGRSGLVSSLTRYASGGGSGGAAPLVVTGTPGCGKSALMAHFVATYRGASPVLAHIVGASSSSTSLRAMIRRLCMELKEMYALDKAVPEDAAQLVRVWPEFLRLAGASGGVVVVIDAVNQLTPDHGAHSMAWLPLTLPPGVRVIVSTLVNETTCLACLRARTGEATITELKVPSLTRDEQRELVVGLLAASHKRLETNQLNSLLAKPSAHLPLYLVAACTDLCAFGIYEQLTDHIQHLPGDVLSLFQSTLTRLSATHGRELVRHALSFIYVSKGGLLESELVELLAKSPRDEARVSNWARLFPSLSPFLAPTGSGLLALFHGQVGELVQRSFSATNSVSGRGIDSGLLESAEDFHLFLADWYWEQANPNPETAVWSGANDRAFAALPYHLTCARDWGRLESILLDVAFLSAKCALCGPTALIDDFMAICALLHSPAGESVPLSFNRESVAAMQQFVVSQLHVLSTRPELFNQAAANTSESSIPCALAAKSTASRSWMRALNKPQGADPCLTTLTGNGDYVLAAALSPDNAVVATASFDKTVRLFEISTGAETRCFEGHADAVLDIKFSADGGYVASGSKDNTARVWSVRSGGCVAVLAEDGNYINAVEWAPPNCFPVRLASGCRDGSIRLWTADSIDSANWSCVAHLVGHTDDVLSLAFRPPPQRLATVAATLPTLASSSGDNRIILWSVLDATQLCELPGHTDDVNTIAFSPDGTLLASVSDDKSLRVWDVDSRECNVVSTVHRDCVMGVSWLPNGRDVATAAYDNTVKIVSAVTGRERKAFTGHSAYVNTVAVTSDGSRIVSASDDTTVKVWDTTAVFTSQVIHSDSVLSVAHAPSDYTSGTQRYEARVVVTGSTDGTAAVVNACSGSVIRRLEGHSGPVSATKLSGNGAFALTASHDTTLCIWNVATGSRSAKLSGGHRALISDADWTPNMSVVVSGGWDKALCVWRGGVRRPYSLDSVIAKAHTKYITSVSLLADGSAVASGSDAAVRVFDVESGRPWSVDYADEGVVNTVLLRSGFGELPTLCNSGGPVLLNGSNRCTRLRDVRVSSAIALELGGHKEYVSSADICQAGRSIVTAAGTELFVWDPRNASAPVNAYVSHYPLAAAAGFGSGFLEIAAVDSGGCLQLLRQEVVEFGCDDSSDWGDW